VSVNGRVFLAIMILGIGVLGILYLYT